MSVNPPKVDLDNLAPYARMDHYEAQMAQIIAANPGQYAIRAYTTEIDTGPGGANRATAYIGIFGPDGELVGSPYEMKSGGYGRGAAPGLIKDMTGPGDGHSDTLGINWDSYLYRTPKGQDGLDSTMLFEGTNKGAWIRIEDKHGRTSFGFHPDNKNVGSPNADDGSMGCFAIAQKDAPRFFAHMHALYKAGDGVRPGEIETHHKITTEMTAHFAQKVGDRGEIKRAAHLVGMQQQGAYAQSGAQQQMFGEVLTALAQAFTEMGGPFGQMGRGLLTLLTNEGGVASSLGLMAAGTPSANDAVYSANNPVYAQPDASPTGAPSGQAPTGPSAQMGQFVADMVRNEDDLNHFYICPGGHVTIGPGLRVTSADQAVAALGADASAADQTLARQVFNDLTAKASNKSTWGRPSGYDKRLTLSAERQGALRAEVAADTLAKVRAHWPGFDSYDPSIQRLMFDLMHNVGLESGAPFTPTGWPGFARTLKFVAANPQNPMGYRALQLESLRRDTTLINPATREQWTGQDLALYNAARKRAVTALLEGREDAQKLANDYLANRKRIGFGGMYGAHDESYRQTHSRNAFAMEQIETAQRAATSTPTPTMVANAGGPSVGS